MATSADYHGRVERLLRLCVVAGISLATPMAMAQSSIERAEEHMEALRYDEAKVLVTEALEGGGLSKIQVTKALSILAELAAILEGPEAGERAFRRLLVLAPSQHQPSTSSPVVADPYVRAREWVESQGILEVAHSPPKSVLAGKPVALEVSIQRDPLAMVAGARTSYRLPGGGFRLLPGRSLSMSLPAVPSGGYVEYYISVVDRYGNELSALGSKSSPLAVHAEGDAPSAKVRAAPRPATWVVAGAGAVALVAAVTFDLAASSEYSTLESRCAPMCTGDELDTFRGRRRVAGALYLGAGALATTAIIMWLSR